MLLRFQLAAAVEHLEVKDAADRLSQVVAADGDAERRIARAVDLISRHVGEHPAHVRFIARERNGGVQPVREAIGVQLALFAEEVKAELARQPESRGWSEEDLLMLAGLYVDQLLMTRPRHQPDAEAAS